MRSTMYVLCSISDISYSWGIQGTHWQSKLRPIRITQSGTWGMVYEDTPRKEVVFVVHGLVTKKSLPPVEINAACVENHLTLA
jgi:hypothetical protein